jgi:hypothetical protein
LCARLNVAVRLPAALDVSIFGDFGKKKKDEAGKKKKKKGGKEEDEEDTKPARAFKVADDEEGPGGACTAAALTRSPLRPAFPRDRGGLKVAHVYGQPWRRAWGW